MKKFLLTLLFLSMEFCYSQIHNVNSNNNEFTTNEIDSICLNTSNIIISEGRTTSKIKSSKKTKSTIGNGGFSYKIYPFHFNEAYFSTLSNIEKREYSFEKHSNLIKGEYHEGFVYNNSYTENINGEFYYFNSNLFYIKIKIIRTEKGKEELSETFNYSVSELNESKAIKNVFLFDVKSWINDKNNEIIKIYNR